MYAYIDQSTLSCMLHSMAILSLQAANFTHRLLLVVVARLHAIMLNCFSGLLVVLGFIKVVVSRQSPLCLQQIYGRDKSNLLVWDGESRAQLQPNLTVW